MVQNKFLLDSYSSHTGFRLEFDFILILFRLNKQLWAYDHMYILLVYVHICNEDLCFMLEKIVEWMAGSKSNFFL